MFDPTSFLATGKWGYICCHTGADYNHPPTRILWNPLRWEIGIGRHRPCLIVINRNGKLNSKVSNLTWKLWRKRRWESRQAGEKG